MGDAAMSATMRRIPAERNFNDGSALTARTSTGSIMTNVQRGLRVNRQRDPRELQKFLGGSGNHADLRIRLPDRASRKPPVNISYQADDSAIDRWPGLIVCPGAMTKQETVQRIAVYQKNVRWRSPLAIP